MSCSKPFHRCYRKQVPGFNSGYNDWVYVTDSEYAVSPEYYCRAFFLLQNEIEKLFEYIEPADINGVTYSYKIHQLLIRICIEVENNFKAILRENIYLPIDNKGRPRLEDSWTINDYRKINKSHHLSSYSVEFPIWRGNDHRIRKPFENWKGDEGLPWYQAYNSTKHNRSVNFEVASFNNLLDAFAGLFIVLTSQFNFYSFQPGPTLSTVNVDSYYKFNGEYGIGNYLLVDKPDDWADDEQYQFDWEEIRNMPDRFAKIDFNSI